MARKRKNSKNKSSFKILLSVLTIYLLVYLIFSGTNINELLVKYTENYSVENNALLDTKKDNQVEGNIEIHYIDVGEGDAILIKQGENTLLIDAGPATKKEHVVEYIKAQGIKKLNYVIATHAHEDHIGSMSYVINNFDIENIMMNKYSSTTKTYENLLLTAQKKKLSFYAPKTSEEFTLGDATFLIICDGENDSENMNNHSIVIKVKYGSTSYMFMADAEEEEELQIINSNIDISADVIKIGHHGSNSSASEVFLNQANPKYAILSVGENNNYGHPCKSTMNLLKKMNITLYRTDESSDIVLISDGKEITFNAVPRYIFVHISKVGGIYES